MDIFKKYYEETFKGNGMLEYGDLYPHQIERMKQSEKYAEYILKEAAEKFHKNVKRFVECINTKNEWFKPEAAPNFASGGNISEALATRTIIFNKIDEVLMEWQDLLKRLVLTQENKNEFEGSFIYCAGQIYQLKRSISEIEDFKKGLLK